MPKQPLTFEKIYPTLHKPFSLQKKSKFTVTLRERHNLSLLSANATTNMDMETINSSIIPNNNLINDNERAIPKYISLPNIHATGHNNINNSNVQDNLIRNTEDYLQEFDFTINDDNISLDDSRSTSSTSYSFSISDDEYTNSNTEVNSTTGHKNYDVDSELPEYIGDSGPYFPSLTAMWMFIWFTKNSIGNVSHYSFKSSFNNQSLQYFVYQFYRYSCLS